MTYIATDPVFKIHKFVHSNVDKEANLDSISMAKFRHHHCTPGSTVMMKSNIMGVAVEMLAGTLVTALRVLWERPYQLRMKELVLMILE